MRTVALAGMIAITTASIVAQGKPDRPATAASPAGLAAAAIREVADAYVKATTSGDAKAVAALYTEDAVEMPPNLPPVKGRAAIQQYLRQGLFERVQGHHLHAQAPRDTRHRRQRLRRRHLRAGTGRAQRLDARFRHRQVRRHRPPHGSGLESGLRDLQQRPAPRPGR